MDQIVTIVGASLIWLAVIVSPGPNFLVVSRLALSDLRRPALGATVGIAAGSLFYAALAMFGLGAVISRLGWLGEGIRIAGGGYLIWLGVQAWRAAPRASSRAEAPSSPHQLPFLQGLRIGLLTEIGNPKAIAFYLGLFSAAVPLSAPLWAKLLLLGIGGCLEIAWYAAVTYALSSGPARAVYGRARRGIDRAVGSVLIALGAKVAWEAA